jgi:hypothetical protein
VLLSYTYRLDKTKPVASANNASLSWRNADFGVTLFASDPKPVGFPSTIVSGTSTGKYIWNFNNLNAVPTVNDCLTTGTTFNSGTVYPLTTE